MERKKVNENDIVMLDVLYYARALQKDELELVSTWYNPKQYVKEYQFVSSLIKTLRKILFHIYDAKGKHLYYLTEMQEQEQKMFSGDFSLSGILDKVLKKRKVEFPIRLDIFFTNITKCFGIDFDKDAKYDIYISPNWHFVRKTTKFDGKFSKLVNLQITKLRINNLSLQDMKKIEVHHNYSSTPKYEDDYKEYPYINKVLYFDLDKEEYRTASYVSIEDPEEGLFDDDLDFLSGELID